MRFLPILVCAVTLISCAATQQTTSQQTTTTLTVNTAVLDEYAFGLPEYPTNGSLDSSPNTTQPAQKQALWATQYYVHYAESTNANGYALLDMNGTSFGVNLSDRDWCFGGVEGTIQVKDSSGKIRTYNYAGRGKEIQVDCSKFFKGPLIKPEAIGRTRYTYATGAFGDGVKGLILVPFRTIAVDTTVFPIGSVVYIPSARGIEIELPSGKHVRHDGYFFAGDIGGAIKGNHIDVFTGVYRSNPMPTVMVSKSSATFDAYRVENNLAITNVLKQLHVPVQLPGNDNSNGNINAPSTNQK
jgi:3D (Asp-Asp-Asp) domain-containing protein